MNRARRTARNRLRNPATRRWTVALGLVALLAGPTVVRTVDAAHPFYERRLAEGTVALQQERFSEAARLLDIAAFGFLEEPPRLAEALVRLALAQAESGEPGAFRETVRRVAEIEERFGAFRDAELSPTERSHFDRRITELTPASELGRTPALQRLLESPRPSDPEGSEGDAPRAEDPDPGRPGREAAATADRSDRSSVEPVPQPAPPPASELSSEERGRLERAREILARARQARELDEAWDLARPIAIAHPTRQDLQQLVGEIAYRSSRWEEAARYLERGLQPVLRSLEAPGGGRPERPELLFYLAVALFESGRPEEARVPLELALPGLERTPFVRSYMENILQPDPSDANPRSPRDTP